MALLLGAIAAGLALLYLALAAFSARPWLRGTVIAAASAVLVVGPTASFVALGVVTDRPYGQDGGVVQMPLALDKILSGQSPYGVDYSDSILGKQARVSSFWETYGGNPILHHHAYLPGTHLLMMPFYLASRRLVGFFDPRFVTVLAYGLAVWLAVGLGRDAAGRLCAAALVALNPLVYWHQIFGANDLIFVALLLGAVALARAERPLLSGLALGLACATKQLAWPFAPFLLLHLSGARAWRELVNPSVLRRMARPAAAASLAFLAVVLPVAALDFRAFYRDIVVYNVGLPGGDNYPLGGTPGFGFANFLIYFSQVVSLHDYFPFGVFYVLLVPLGLILLRVQLRQGSAATALFTGSAALLASVYFSRVVHPNYLMAVAILLPLAFLSRRREADVPVVTLLLLALAVEIAEHALFRTTWEDAVAAGIPRQLKGLAATLAPRAGVHLTQDPLGLLLSGTAAGLGLAYLILCVLDASPRVRSLFVLLAAVTLVVGPSLLLVFVGQRTGTARAQDPWVVEVPAAARRLAHGASPLGLPPPADSGREAWTNSFRREPPEPLVGEAPLLPPGAITLAALTPGLRDARAMSLLALGLVLLLVSRLVEPGARPLALALAGLAPPIAVGTVFGSPATLPLAALLGVLGLAAGGRAFLAGVLAGAAGALDHRAWLAVPFLVSPLARAGREGVAWARVAGGATVGYLALVLPAVLPDAGAFTAALRTPVSLAPGLGVVNLFLYGEAPESVLVFSVFALAPLAAALFVGALLFGRAGRSALALAGLAAAGGLYLSTGISPEAVAVPLVLIGLCALREV